jgi:hypothetical protein
MLLVQISFWHPESRDGDIERYGSVYSRNREAKVCRSICHNTCAADKVNIDLKKHTSKLLKGYFMSSRHPPLPGLVMVPV